MKEDSDNQDVTCPECGAKKSTKDEKCISCNYDPTLVASSASYQAKFAVTAQLFRSAGSVILEHKLGSDWNLGNNAALDFLIRVERKFTRKSKHHGFLEKDTLPNAIPQILKNYISGKIAFRALVENTMVKMRMEANSDRQGKPSGGEVVFIHYVTAEDLHGFGRLLVIMVDNKGVFDFDENLVPKKLNSVDIEALRQAAMIDLSLFNVAYPTNDSEPYVKFIVGKSRSEFFKRSLGCNPKIDNKRSIDEVFKALTSFSRDMKLSIPEEDGIRDHLKNYVDKKAKDKVSKAITLQDIEREIDRFFCDKENIKNKFVDYVNLKEFKVDPVFEPTFASGLAATSIAVNDDTKNYDCRISINAIGNKGEGKPIVFDQKNKTITIKISDDNVQLIAETIRSKI